MDFWILMYLTGFLALYLQASASPSSPRMDQMIGANRKSTPPRSTCNIEACVSLTSLADTSLISRGHEPQPHIPGCTFIGTAPFCWPRHCPKGTQLQAHDSCGTGKCCVIGRKWLCCKPPPFMPTDPNPPWDPAHPPKNQVPPGGAPPQEDA